MNNFSYLYVLEHSYPAILEIELTEEDKNLTVSEILYKHGYKESQCSYMCTKNKLSIQTIKD